jgi:hypothetical protein
MSSDLFRYRGVSIAVDMAETADMDVLLYGLSEKDLKGIHKSLTELVHSPSDRHIGGFSIREVRGYDVVFIVGREKKTVVVTIGRIVPPDPKNPTEQILKLLNIAATFRGATKL